MLDAAESRLARAANEIENLHADVRRCGIHYEAAQRATVTYC